MLIDEILNEGMPQGGTLYHATDVMNAARILLSDYIDANVDHLSLKKNGKAIKGVSLTRSFRFAVDWKRAGVVFQLNGDLIRANQRLHQYDYYRDRRESEEFVAGQIKPLARYLTAIYMTPETRDYCVESDEELIEGHKDYDQLLSHPLLIVKEFPSQVAYYNPRKPGKGMMG